MVSFDLDRPQI